MSDHSTVHYKSAEEKKSIIKTNEVLHNLFYMYWLYDNMINIFNGYTKASGICNKITGL